MQSLYLSSLYLSTKSKQPAAERMLLRGLFLKNPKPELGKDGSSNELDESLGYGWSQGRVLFRLITLSHGMHHCRLNPYGTIRNLASPVSTRQPPALGLTLGQTLS